MVLLIAEAEKSKQSKDGELVLPKPEDLLVNPEMAEDNHNQPLNDGSQSNPDLPEVSVIGNTEG